MTLAVLPSFDHEATLPNNREEQGLREEVEE